MSDIEAPAKNWRTILTLSFSALGILYLFVQAISLVAIWLIASLNDQLGITQNIPMGLLAWSSLFLALMLLPVFLLSLYQLRGQPIPAWLDADRPVMGKWAWRLIFVWPVVVFIGWLVAGNPSLATFILGPINLLMAGLPVLWIYSVAQWKLEGGTQMRRWRIFGFSLTVTPFIVIIIEVIAISILVLFGLIWLAYRLSFDPQIEREIMYIANQIMISGQDTDKLLQLLEPYILQPSVIVWALAIFGGVMPMIEEIVKPLALWSMAGRKLSPQEGFVGGLLCGAGFALLENILYFTTAVTSEDWLFMAIGRAGTGAMHVLGSGLVGWGLAKAWREGKWGFLGLSTLTAFLFHSLWNILAMLSGIAPLYLIGPEITIWQTVMFNLPMLLLMIIAILTMFWIHRYLRTKGDQNLDETSDINGETEGLISL